MEINKVPLYILLSILSLSICAPPQTPEPMEQIEAKALAIVNKKDHANLLFKRLDSSRAKLDIDNSNVIMTFNENFRTIEHQVIVGAYGLGEGSYFEGWEFSTSAEGISKDDITNSCEIKKADGSSSESECTATNNIDESDETKIKFKYEGEIWNGEKLIINYKYNKIKTPKDILYKQEPIVIPLITGSSRCDYKFIIPEGEINLGLKDNLLTKESETTYIYKGDCPTTAINDVIRYSPQEVMWKADMELSLEYTPKFTNDVIFLFPRYYRGAKLNNTYYRIFSSEEKSYKESESIDNDITFLKVTVPAANKDKVSAKLYTAFFNRLKDKFKVYLPESSYNINLSKIDQEIIDKAKEIKNEHPDKPYYYIGKFVHSHINYDINFVGRELTLKEIYEDKTGVCEHYTLLYNAMLNAIGIKTLYLSGWAFDNDITSGDKSTLTHAWTAALINENWIELDATWGLFEGIPAGHIFKNFNDDKYSYSWYEKVGSVSPTFKKTPTIQMVTDPNDLVDPFPQDIDDSGDDDKDEESTEIKENIGENDDDNNSGKKNEDEEKDTKNSENGENPNKSSYLNLPLNLLILFGLISF